MIRHVSVIVPVYNCEPYVGRTLASIEQSIQFFQTHYQKADQVTVEVILVNDASTDQTVSVVMNFIRSKPHYTLIHHACNQGAAAARNTGVRQSRGEILFFCDGDDLFLREHLYVGYRSLNQELIVQSDSRATLRPQHPDSLSGAAGEPLGEMVAVVKTKVRISDPVHPHWKEAIENSLPTNLCLRRECHEFLEGFPEAAVYRQIGGREDTAYMKWLGKFFKVFKAELETVVYLRYPGNSFDRQLTKFQTPPENYQPNWTAEEQQLHQIAHQLEEERLHYLHQKLLHLHPRYTPTSLFQWPVLIREALAQKRYSEAIHYYEQAVATHQPLALMDINSLAYAYNKAGVLSHQTRQLDQALAYFQKALALAPTWTNSDLARLHLNLGLVLIDQGYLEQALPVVERSHHLDPALAQPQLDWLRAKLPYKKS